MHSVSPEMETDTAAAAAISEGLNSKNSIAAFNFINRNSLSLPKLVANKERLLLELAFDQ